MSKHDIDNARDRLGLAGALQVLQVAICGCQAQASASMERILRWLLFAIWGCSVSGSLDELLREPLRGIPYLHLLLRSNRLAEDAANDNARWFMQLTELPHSLHSYDERQPLGMVSSLRGYVDSRDSLVLVISLPQLISNMGAAGSVQRAGVYFYILADQVDELSQQQLLELEQSCRQQWNEQRLFNRFILTDNGVWVYDPFARNDDYDEERLQLEGNEIENEAYGDSFGRLVPYVGGQALPMLLFQNMRGYPLRVQIFKSVYARPQLDPDTGLLQSITGVDWEVAKMLSARLNYTMLLQEPNKHYFG